MLGSDNINNEEIIGIIELDIEISNRGYMVERDQILSSKFRGHNGLLRTNAEMNKSDITIPNFTGRIRILIFYVSLKIGIYTYGQHCVSEHRKLLSRSSNIRSVKQIKNRRDEVTARIPYER